LCPSAVNAIISLLVKDNQYKIIVLLLFHIKQYEEEDIVMRIRVEDTMALIIDFRRSWFLLYPIPMSL
jgi:hypothetical protein